MEDDTLLTVAEESSGVYNIKHRAFYFAKDVIRFIGEQKYERIYFSLLNSLSEVLLPLEQIWLKA